MNNNTFIHKYLKNLSFRMAADMTCGNGNDTFFLAERAAFVYAFDISKEAIDNTKKRCKDFDNIIYINDDHQNIDKYLKEKADLIIFNLGYLPKSDTVSVTKTASSLTAIKKALGLCRGYLIITFYRGHQGGKDEYLNIINYLENNNIRPVESYRQYRSSDEPLTNIYKI